MKEGEEAVGSTTATVCSLPPRIQLLPTAVVNKIAAGEVIQRPCNAVKELIENSLDAGSTMIQVNIRAGGLKLIQVLDNGHGIQPTDLPILCDRFTTSKIKEFDDLSSLTTFGFRGEALASLTYVSRLSVTTRTAGRACAYKADYAAGQLKGTPRPCAGNHGTSVQAEDLFYNVPVRRDALKSHREEFTRIAEIVARYSLHYAGKCGFFLRSLDRKVSGGGPNSPACGGGSDLRTTKELSQLEVIRSVFGQSSATDLLSIAHHHDCLLDIASTRLAVEKLGLRFECLLSNPRKITSEGVPCVQLVLFVNNRLVECAAVKRSIESAYAALLPHRAALLCVGPKTKTVAASSSSSLFAYVSLQLPTASLDVNVHPTKAEVHFLHEDEIATGLRDAVERELFSSTGSCSLYVHSLSLSQFGYPSDGSQTPPQVIRGQSRSSRQQTLSGGLSGNVSAANSPSSGYRPECMVRTDTCVQRLEAFLRPPLSSIEKRGPSSPDVEDSDDDEEKSCAETDAVIKRHPISFVKRERAVNINHKYDEEIPEFLQECSSVKTAEVSCASSCKLPTGGRRPVLLSSVITMREAIEARASADARNLLRECIFIGCVGRANIVVQQSTKLLLMRLHPLMKELFYQLMVVNFANHGELVLTRPAPVRPILIIGLRKSLPDVAPSDLEVMADKGCSILSKRADMLWEYFSIKFQPDDTGVLFLHGLPFLIDRFIPNMNHLPSLLSRFVREINWNEEGACFDGICRAMANFYAKRIKDRMEISSVSGTPESKRLLASSASSSGESENEAEENCVDEKENASRQDKSVSWTWTVEHVLLPTIRSVLLPSHTMCFETKSETVPCLTVLTSLPELYKVFERC